MDCTSLSVCVCVCLCIQYGVHFKTERRWLEEPVAWICCGGGGGGGGGGSWWFVVVVRGGVAWLWCGWGIIDDTTQY